MPHCAVEATGTLLLEDSEAGKRIKSKRVHVENGVISIGVEVDKVVY